MAMPKQVEAQLKQVEEIEKQLMGKQESETPQQEAEPADTSAEQQTETAVDQPQAEPTQVVEPAKPNWEQKYRTLQGMFDAEVPRLHARNKELERQVQQLQQQIEALKQASKQEASVQDRLVSDSDVETFGEDLIDLQRRVAREVAMEFKKEIEELKAENARLNQLIQQTGSRVGEMTFEQQLRRAIPDFDVINNDPRWFAWLDEVLPDVGVPRRMFAQKAYEAGDVEAVKRFVDVFRGTLAPSKSTRQTELERQVQPSRSNAAVQNPAPTARTYTTTQVEQMFNKVRDLNIKGKYDEAAKLEAEITAAFAEGRVVHG